MAYPDYSSDALARSPGVGETGSTDATDLANLRVSAAMRAADQANANGGSNIIPMPPQNSGGNLFAPPSDPSNDSATAIAQLRNERLLALNSSLNNNTDPDNPAIYVTPKRRAELLLERRDLTGAVHDQTMDEARLAHQNFVMQQDVTAGQQFRGLADRLSQITSDPTMPAGSPERGAALIKAAQDFPDGFASRAGQDLTRGITEGHDQQAALEDRAYWQRFGQAHNEAAQVGKKFGVDVQYNDQGFPSMEATTQYGQENGTIEAATKPPNAAYVKQVAALAEMKARKDAAYNANHKADLTSHDKNIAIEQARLDAMKEALGTSTAPAAPVEGAAPTDQAKHLGKYNPVTGNFE